MNVKTTVALCLFAWLLGVPAVSAQMASEDDTDAPRGELQREMRRFFQDRLRAELSLTDEQAERVLPRLQQLERSRRAFQRERMDTTKRLRWGMEHGASDQDLEELLESLDRQERDQFEQRRSALAEIDGELGVRQRVELRFFIERFPRMLREKIMDLRRGAGGPPPPLPPRSERRP